MIRIYCITLSLFFSLAISGVAGTCPYEDSLWQNYKPSRQQKLLKRPSFTEMDSECFATFLHRYSYHSRQTEKTTALFSFLKEYCRISNSFTPAVLHSFLGVVDSTNYTSVSDGIAALWKTYNGAITLQLRKLEGSGRYTEADTLYSDFGRLSLLEVYDLLKWARIKSILGDFNGAVRIYCKASSAEKAFVNVALNQLQRALADVNSPKTRRRILDRFSACYRSHPRADLDTLSRWLSAVYRHFAFFPEEEDAIVAFDRNPESRGKRLLDAARYRFARNLFTEALSPARKAWQHLQTESRRQACAIICYQSYTQIGKPDSALLWLQKVNLIKEQSRVEAVILYQSTGFFSKADSIVRTLPKSVTRDTLLIRQQIFHGSLQKAQSHIIRCAKKPFWKKARADRFLWHLRIGVFSGSLPQVSGYLDSLGSIQTAPSWRYTEEILATQLALQRLGVYQDAFQYWGRIRQALYRRKPRDPVASFNGERWPEQIQEFLVSTLVDGLIRHEYFDTAQYVLDQVPQFDSPQITYFRGLVFFMRGYGTQAKQLFEHILVSYPDDVFAHKARIYLMKLKRSQSM